MCVGLMVQTNLKFTSNVLVHFMLFIFDNLYGFSTHGLQCHKLTWTLREGFSAFCWMEPACVAKFTLQSLSCRKPAVAGLKAWSNTSHYAFCSTWHITWEVTIAEAQFMSQNVSIFINFTGAHTCKSFQGKLMGLNVRKLSSVLYILGHSPPIYTSNLKNEKAFV